jgi:hypothetical protein
MSLGRVSLIVSLLLGCPGAAFGQTQPVATVGTKVVQVKGLTGVKGNTKGLLTVDDGHMHFSHGHSKVDVPAPSIEDVVTGNDSQRAIGGALGTISQFGPYGSGRFLSLFRTKLETLTIQYHDTDGGLHGVVFTMAVGKAEELKKDLLANGAHTSVPSDEGADKPPAAKEQKP